MTVTQRLTLMMTLSQEQMTVYADTDGDGFGDANVTYEVCERTDGWVDNSDDCNDALGAIHPGAEEVIGDAGVDQDCDTQETCYEDLDGDGFGSEICYLNRR